ncbi:MAG: M24 family metallopeptidase [Candidatus Lokiarchaeota archaeon]|nr:M24 family metallopeptidase [Candidatus Lokiarchaeota archaeon]
MLFIDKEKFDRVKKGLEKSKLDGLLVRLPENVLYFSNWWPITGWGAAFIPLDGDPILITPDSETIFAKRRIINDLREYEPNGNDALINELSKLSFAEKKMKIGVEKTVEAIACTHLGYELSIPNNPFFDKLSKELKNWELVDATNLLTELRAVKTEFEFKQLKLVNELNYYGLEAIADALHQEKTEMEIATLCESTINNKIVDYKDNVDFVRAFAFVMGGPENGARACWPYNISSAYKMKKGELCMIELNTQVNGYWSDITRTWVVGRNPTTEQRDMMDTINGGIEEAMKASKPGTATHEVDKASREFIIATKWGKYHTPFLGHGIGVKLHEPIPMLYPNSPGTVELGHYYTIEPGLYGKEIKGALRIERDVWLSDSGVIATDEFPCEL